MIEASHNNAEGALSKFLYDFIAVSYMIVITDVVFLI